MKLHVERTREVAAARGRRVTKRGGRCGHGAARLAEAEPCDDGRRIKVGGADAGEESAALATRVPQLSKVHGVNHPRRWAREEDATAKRDVEAAQRTPPQVSAPAEAGAASASLRSKRCTAAALAGDWASTDVVADALVPLKVFTATSSVVVDAFVVFVALTVDVTFVNVVLLVTFSHDVFRPVMRTKFADTCATDAMAWRRRTPRLPSLLASWSPVTPSTASWMNSLAGAVTGGEGGASCEAEGDGLASCDAAAVGVDALDGVADPDGVGEPDGVSVGEPLEVGDASGEGDDVGLAPSDSVAVGVDSLVGVTEPDGEGVPVGEADCVGVTEELAPCDSVAVGVGDLKGVAELEREEVPLAVNEGVAVGVGELVRVAELDGVRVLLTVLVADCVGVTDGLAPSDNDAVGVGALEGVTELVSDDV